MFKILYTLDTIIRDSGGIGLPVRIWPWAEQIQTYEKYIRYAYYFTQC
jgi:hypothetical protein